MHKPIWIALGIALQMAMSNAIAHLPACKRTYETPLLTAVADRQIDEVRDLLKQGNDSKEFESTGGFWLKRALDLAIRAYSTYCTKQPPSPELVRLLIDAGASVHAAWHVDEAHGEMERYNALQFAALAGNVEIVSIVLAAGARLDDRTNYGRTALLIAVQQKQVDIVERLLRAGANPNLATNGVSYAKGLTPFHFAARWSGTGNRLAKLLASHGAKYKITDLAGPFFQLAQFHTAPISSTDELISLLIKAGGNINEKNIDGPFSTPLNAGLNSSHASREVLEAMLRNCADPNRGALYALAFRQDSHNLPLKRRELLDLVVQYGARPNLTQRRNERGDVFKYAARFNQDYARELNEKFSKPNPSFHRTCAKSRAGR